MRDAKRIERERLTRLDPAALASHQLARLNAMLSEILPDNGFYADKLSHLNIPLKSLDDLASFPFTYKEELVGVAFRTDFPANLTYPLESYVRYHQTSGTRGKPLPVLDTAKDWQWWVDCWQYVLDAADIHPGDRVMMAFSFGPFIGFWTAHDAVIARGALVIPSGGFGTTARLELIRNTGATVVFSTPSYALHMAEVAHDRQINLPALGVRKMFVAGEPGGSVTSVRERIEKAWNAKLTDHAGASEIGPWGYSDPQQRGLYVMESEFIAEFLSHETGEPATEGELSELVLTSLGRWGSPVIRYRTGDLVKPIWNHGQDCSFVLLEGGILGRVDDMVVVRGVNIFPSSIEQIIRSFPEVIEYRLTASRKGEMDHLKLEIEDRLQKPERISDELQVRLGLKIDVTLAPTGSLPRFEGKGKHFIDNRNKGG